MRRSELVQVIFKSCMPSGPQQSCSTAFAPINLALSKYWGKRDNELNLPHTSSLSVAIPTRGTRTTLRWDPQKTQDEIIYNGQTMAPENHMAIGIRQFLDLFRTQTRKWYLQAGIEANVPLAAGFASSASGFAALVLALNDLCAWNLTPPSLSILARLGSGSAARSLWTGFVEWHRGQRSDGMDSYAVPLPNTWPELCVGLLPICTDQKPISSRNAMRRTVETSRLYQVWTEQVQQNLSILKQAITGTNFPLLGQYAEQNALSMHATMLSSWPPVCYFLPETIAAMHRIWDLRKLGLAIYMTQDAGPNLKLLFLGKDSAVVQQSFPTVEIINCF